jgi:hypothetical protein
MAPPPSLLVLFVEEVHGGEDVRDETQPVLDLQVGSGGLEVVLLLEVRGLTADVVGFVQQAPGSFSDTHGSSAFG